MSFEEPPCPRNPLTPEEPPYARGTPRCPPLFFPPRRDRASSYCCSFDWSNAKGTGNASGWAKHSPMDDEEMLYQQVQMTTAETPGSTVWVYRCSVYAYPCVARACVEVRNVCCHSTFAPAAGTRACARF